MAAEGSELLFEVRKETLSDRVYDQLARGLMTGLFKPGALVTLRDLAKYLGTSSMPVREAVWHLTAQQALIIQRNKSIQIPLLNDAEFHQLWHLREMLESEACAQAAPKMKPPHIRKLTELIAVTYSALEAQDFRDIIGRSHEFFFDIYEASDNSVLVSMIKMLWLRTGPLYHDTLSSIENLGFIRESLEHNRELLDALRIKDAEAAREVRSRDLSELSAWLQKHRTRTKKKPVANAAAKSSQRKDAISS